MAKCISCNKEADNYISFKCPRCSEKIIRCNHCRELDIDYKCPNKKCTFVGP